MCMLLYVILSVQLCFYHLSQDSVCPVFLFVCFVFLVQFLALVIIGGFVFWFGSSLLSFFLLLKKFFLIIIFYFNNFILFYFILFYLLLSFFLFFLPFILSRVDDRLLVLQPGIRAVPLRWESQLQDTGPQETSQLHVISNGKNLPEISISMPRPSYTQRPASYRAGYPMPNNQQDRNTTPSISREAA